MKFGKASDLSNIDFSLPIDPSTNKIRLDRYGLGTGEGRPQIYIGATGWSMKDWVGTWYPRKTKSADYLKHYGRQFNTIELNTTHYRVPTIEMVQKWYDSVPEDFRFCPKVPQTTSQTTSFLPMPLPGLPATWKRPVSLIRVAPVVGPGLSKCLCFRCGFTLALN